ncbi:MAG: polysaccharide pyruvyl transferase family protein [Oligoflexus sp.]
MFKTLKNVVRIGISGSYGGLNLGDEAILHSIVSQIRRSLPAEITVFSRNPADTLRRHQIDRAFAAREMTRLETRQEISNLDFFILGGGGILYDAEVDAYLREVMIAHELSIPVMIYAVSVGPLTQSSSRKQAKEALNQAAIITVRDRQGHRLLEDIGVQQSIHLTADPALLLGEEELTDEALQAEGINLGGKRLVGFSLREPGPAAPDLDIEYYHNLIANVADFMVHRLDADIVMVPMEQHNMDIQHSHAVVAKMKSASRATILKREYSAGQILSLMKRFEFVVGMRLHSLIFAALQGIPFVPLPYSSKVTGFVEALEMNTEPLEQVNAGQLIAVIDRAWDFRAEMRHHLIQKIPGLKDLAKKNHQYLLDYFEQNHMEVVNRASS